MRACFVPIHDRHVQVQYDRTEVVFRPSCHNLQGLETILSGGHLKVVFKLVFVAAKKELLVVDHKHFQFLEKRFFEKESAFV